MEQSADDIGRGVMELASVSTLLLLVGRADVLNNEDTTWVLDRLQRNLEQVQYQGNVVLTGPLPLAHDRRMMCQDFKEQHQIMREHLSVCKRIHYTDAGLVMFDDRGIIPQLMDENGLTLDGQRELSEGLALVS